MNKDKLYIMKGLTEKLMDNYYNHRKQRAPFANNKLF